VFASCRNETPSPWIRPRGLFLSLRRPLAIPAWPGLSDTGQLGRRMAKASPRSMPSSTRPVGAGFKSLGDAWADTTTPHGRLMLTVLGGLAEFERELILARTSDGRARAKDRGVKFGRPQRLTPHQRQEALQRLEEGYTQADLARTYGVSQATISRLAAV
jgi:DNA invertase Pin-like site-specific DNA recombinase